MLFMCWTRETGVIPGALAGLLLGMKAPGAQMIVSVTFIAILMTILIQAPTTKWLGKRLGPSFVLPGLVAKEREGNVAYNQMADATGMARDEQSHAMLITQITRTMRGGFEGGALAMLEGRHKATGGNALRAAVLGANDGLVSNLSLVMGVAGAALNNKTILITGLAGLLAGSISMALGEWLSVQSSRELFSHQIKIEEADFEDVIRKFLEKESRISSSGRNITA